MEVVLFWLALIFCIFFLPWILAIVALVKVNRLRDEMVALRRRVEGDVTTVTSPVQPPPEAPVPATVEPPPVPAPPPSSKPPVPVASMPSTPETSRGNPEVWLGGRLASFAGIGLLLVGLALLVGYAVRHAWMGPAARVALGLLGGTALVGLGHAAETRGGGRLMVLARVLTGGGTAVFYFSLYAAFGMYALIGPVPASLGLLAAAAATVGLAQVYRSQTVAVIGVIGAFAMPALISDDAGRVVFLLTYIATVNVPVIVLGVRRKWQGLYNTAFGFTAAYQWLLLSDLTQAQAPWLLGFSILYFLQFAGLGLVKLRAERALSARQADVIRLILNSLCLLGMTYGVLHQWGQTLWMGTVFLMLAVLHIGLARFAWRWFPAFVDEVLTLLMGALLFASLALPAQLDGAWISVGWGLMGVVVCLLALRAKIPLLQGGALVLGLTGLLRSIGYDWRGYDAAPALFLNARFMAGLVTAFLLGVQGWLHQRAATRPPGPDPSSHRWTGHLSGLAVMVPAWAMIGVWLLCMADIFWTIGLSDPWAWLLSSGTWVAIAAVCGLWGLSQPAIHRFGYLLLALLPLKLMLAIFIGFSLPGAYRSADAFGHGIFVGFIALIVMLFWLGQRYAGSERSVPLTGWPLSVWLHMGAVVALILLVTQELYRLDHAWTQALITLAWGLSASALAAWGLLRRQIAYRYAGLALFAATTVKVLFMDLQALDGLARIAAFMGVGVLLLWLSFLYQRMAARLVKEAAGLEQKADHDDQEN